MVFYCLNYCTITILRAGSGYVYCRWSLSWTRTRVVCPYSKQPTSYRHRRLTSLVDLPKQVSRNAATATISYPTILLASQVQLGLQKRANSLSSAEASHIVLDFTISEYMAVHVIISFSAKFFALLHSFSI